MNSDLLEFLYQAFRSTSGIVLSTNKPEALAGRLRRLLKEDPEFTALEIEVSKTAPQNEVWIKRKDTPDAPR